jgi:hypothetical protein
VVILSTDAQKTGTTYTLRVDGVKDAAGNAILATSNFLGSGKAQTAVVKFTLDDTAKATATEAWMLISVNPATGAFSTGKNRVQLKDDDGDHIWEATVNVAIDPARTASTDDDGMGVSRVGYTARAVDPDGLPLSKLAAFEVKTTDAVDVVLPPLGGTVNPGGSATVTFKIDDRPAKVLTAPTLKASFDASGNFDTSLPTTLTLKDDDGDHIWEVTADVKVDPNRVVGGSTQSTYAYTVILEEGGQRYSARSADFAVPNDSAKTVELLMGSKDKVPVTFRVDVSSAWLTPDGSKKGIYPFEAVFLTGEFGQAEDAFGSNAADAFTGGENPVLQMKELAGHPGVWSRTIFLPKSRPYGWKVVRCEKDVGCSKLNKLVVSSGRAFPTVMKNLVTELCDSSRSSWTDTECSSPKVIDPRDLSNVDTGAGTMDYSSASIYEGTGAGLTDQKDPAGTPTASQMFKQEAPDLVVRVADKAVVTPVYVVGTWRDVNIPGTPQDIEKGGTTVDLADTDYDAGFIGSFPPSYELTVEPPPKPVCGNGKCETGETAQSCAADCSSSPVCGNGTCETGETAQSCPKDCSSSPVDFTLDGALDSSASKIAGTATTMSLYAAYSKGILYLATDDAGEGSDHFILINATGGGSPRPAMASWKKAGTVAFKGKTLFIADENDNNYCQVSELDPDKMLTDGSTSTKVLGCATQAQNGGVLEAVIDLKQAFGSEPTSVFIAVGPWGNDPGGEIYAPAAVLSSNNGDANIDAGELVEVSIPGLQVK